MQHIDQPPLFRWDPKEVEQLPSCMQTCFWKLYDTTNDVALAIQQQKGCKFPVSTYLQKVVYIVT